MSGLYVSKAEALKPSRGDVISFSGAIKGLWPEGGREYSVEVKSSGFMVVEAAGK